MITDTIDPRIEKLAELLEQQILDSTISDGTIWNKMGLSRTNFYRLKPKAILLLQQKALQRQKELDSIKLHGEKEALKRGLKTKSDRILVLQNEIDQCYKELYGADALNYSVVGGKLLNVKTQLTVEQKCLLRKTIKELQAEISKIEGDYAPKKFQDVTTPRVLIPGEDE